MINGHLINHYYIIELFNDLIGKNRFPQSTSRLRQSLESKISHFSVRWVRRTDVLQLGLQGQRSPAHARMPRHRARRSAAGQVTRFSGQLSREVIFLVQ